LRLAALYIAGDEHRIGYEHDTWRICVLMLGIDALVVPAASETLDAASISAALGCKLGIAVRAEKPKIRQRIIPGVARNVVEDGLNG
jgi:hypothetical protein